MNHRDAIRAGFGPSARAIAVTSAVTACALSSACKESAPPPKPPAPFPGATTIEPKSSTPAPSPAPMPAPGPSSTPSGASSGAPGAAAGGGAPGAGAASPASPIVGAVSSASSDPTLVEVAGFVMPKPVAWQWQKPTMQFRTLQYSVPSDGGASPAAELIFSAFPKGGAGPLEANLQRWAGQFRTDDGSEPAPVRAQSTAQVNGLKVARIELHGAYMGMGAAAPRPGTTQLGAIVEGPSSDLFIRLLGPEATVNEARAAFERMLAEIRPQSAASAPAPPPASTASQPSGSSAPSPPSSSPQSPSAPPSAPIPPEK
ncbi:MAG: hypothetical protein FJ253_09015 [Phycisphaerae bacterium]|nr:hypothetical protein [Phycisphaerae bacterium]